MNRRLFTSVLFACLLPFMVQAQQAVFRFAQLTDIHLSPNNPNPTEDLLRSIAQINATDSIDFVLVTGDIAEEGVSPWGFVTVLGRVEKPGRIALPATRDMTVSGAIQKAGGFATSAKDNGILVTRLLPNGKTEARTINMRAVGTAGRLQEDIILEANDVVFVPEAMF